MFLAATSFLLSQEVVLPDVKWSFDDEDDDNVTTLMTAGNVRSFLTSQYFLLSSFFMLLPNKMARMLNADGDGDDDDDINGDDDDFGDLVIDSFILSIVFITTCIFAVQAIKMSAIGAE